ncbi:hypothetical protein CEV33_4562 [Brucella grignonensis]|uniref:Uncharacterized protein n=2 Tax=Brucella grignonensis TaxID=94627 RepID=A0A256GLZ7_9HYPH|nr:hypothetical protein CEV33_4562 [Brucella grignonensis]
MPAHGFSVPAVIIGIVSSSRVRLRSVAPAVFTDLLFVGVLLASIELCRFSFSQFQVQ